MSENLSSDEPRRLAADASYDLALPGSFTYSRVQRRVNEFKYLRARGSENERDALHLARKETAAGSFSQEKLVFGVARKP